MEPGDVTPEKIGGFRVIRRLATGGTSDVLLARAEGPHGFERPVVLKLLLSQYRDEPSFEGMFAREAAAYARLSHPAIVRLFDFFSDRGQLVMVLEFVDGLPLNKLRALLKSRGGDLDDRASLFIGSRIFAALSAAHAARDPESGEFAPVIHRDVNPSNVLIPWDGHVKLADFGIAKVAGMQSDTQAGYIKGTYGYMAPEQVRGEAVTPRADVYAGTLLLWEMLTRRKAIQRGALPEMEVLRAMAEPQLPSIDMLRADLPAPLREAIKRGLEPNPDKRAIFADELVAILRSATNLDEGRLALVDAIAQVRPAPMGEDLEKTQESRPPRASEHSFPGAPADTDVGMRISLPPETERVPSISSDDIIVDPSPPALQPPRPNFAPPPPPPAPPRPGPAPPRAPIARMNLTKTMPLGAQTAPPATIAANAKRQERTLQGGFVPPSVLQDVPLATGEPFPPPIARPPAPLSPPPPPPSASPPASSSPMHAPPIDQVPSAPAFGLPSFPAPPPVSSMPPNFGAAISPPPAAVAIATAPDPFAPEPRYAIGAPAQLFARPSAPSQPPSHSHANAPRVDAFANGAPMAMDPATEPRRPVKRDRGWVLGAMVGLLVASIVMVAGLLFIRYRREVNTRTSAATSSSTPSTKPTTPSTIAKTTTASSAPAPVAANASSTSVASAAAIASTTAAPSDTSGDLDTSGTRPDHRVWVDGRVVGQTPGTFRVPCGRRSVRLGSHGSMQSIEIPCGGQVHVGDR